jgi:NitT/TauT family transport system permease protein
VLLALWQGLVMAFDVPKYLVPSPWRVAQTLVADWALLSGALLTTLKVTLLAFGLAVLIGVLIAFAFVQSRLIETALFPYAVLLQVTPIVAIAPLIIIWAGDINLALLICAWIVAFFPILSNTIMGLNSADHNLINLFQLYKANRWQALRYLRDAGWLDIDPPPDDDWDEDDFADTGRVRRVNPYAI